MMSIMRRKALLSICIALLSASTLPTRAVTVTINNLVYNIDTSKSTAVVQSAYYGMNYSGYIIIPQSVTYQNKAYTVVGIDDSCFSRAEIEGITIPSTVTSIGKNAFYLCEKLKKINIPNSVTTIGESAFSNSSISEITLSTSLKSIPKNAFYHCENMTHIELPNSVTSIGESAFAYSALVSISFPSVLNSIGSSAFKSCKNLNEIVLPNSVTIIGPSAFAYSAISRITFSSSLGSIGASAFAYCSNLDNIVLPNTLHTLGQDVFRSCSVLSKIELSSSLRIIPEYAFANCIKLTEINLCEGVTTLRSRAFWECNSLHKVIFSSTVNSIKSDAFSGCNNLECFEVAENNNSFCAVDGVLYSKSMYTLWKYPPIKEGGKLYLPESVQEIADEAFYGVTSLFSIEEAPNLRRIGNSAFAFSNLSYINLPSCLTQIGDLAFMGCHLGTLVFPSGITKLGDGLFCEKGYVSVLFLLCKIDENCTALRGLTDNTTIYTPASQVDLVSNLCKARVFPIGTWPDLIDVTSYLKGVEFRLNPEAEEKPILTFIYGDGSAIKPDDDGVYHIYDLDLNTKYEIRGWFFKNIYSYYQPLGTVQTLRPTVSGSVVKATETTLTFEVSAMSDKTCQPTEYGIYCNGNYHVADKDGKVTVNGLNPGRTYNVSAYARYGEYYISSSFSAYTTSINLWVTQTELTPTTFACTGSYKTEETQIEQSGFLDQESDGSHLRLTGLIPDKQYTVTFFVRTTNGGQYTQALTFTTPKVTIETQNTKVVSKGTAIVCAKTNLGDDDSAEVGFEWRKLDAPDIIPSKTGTAILYEGSMEGIIRNLDATSYYKVRPYFIDSAGKTYYGEWTGFDPNEFSYFEATVHTYANVQVGQGQATLRGYALGGTDDIIEQGFEYWRLRQNNASSARRAPEDGRIVVKATGQRMEATITGLDDNTVYGFRAYAKTATQTTYGEEIEFTTPIASGIERTEAEVLSSDERKGVYTLSGQRLDIDESALNSLPRGIYIVNGRKVVVK